MVISPFCVMFFMFSLPAFPQQKNKSKKKNCGILSRVTAKAHTLWFHAMINLLKLLHNSIESRSYIWYHRKKKTSYFFTDFSEKGGRNGQAWQLYACGLMQYSADAGVRKIFLTIIYFFKTDS